MSTLSVIVVVFVPIILMFTLSLCRAAAISDEHIEYLKRERRRQELRRRRRGGN